MTRPFARWIACFLAAACLGGCAMPHVTVHDDPLSSEEHLTLGVAYENKGQLDLAEEQYRKATDLPESWLFLGNLAFLREQWDDAETLYERAVRKMPENPAPRNNLAWLYHTRGKHLERAEKLAREAVRLAGGTDDAAFRDTLDAILRQRAEQGSGAASESDPATGAGSSANGTTAE